MKHAPQRLDQDDTDPEVYAVAAVTARQPSRFDEFLRTVHPDPSLQRLLAFDLLGLSGDSSWLFASQLQSEDYRNAMGHLKGGFADLSERFLVEQAPERFHLSHLCFRGSARSFGPALGSHHPAGPPAGVHHAVMSSPR